MTAETGTEIKSGIDAGLWGVIQMSRRHPESGSPKGRHPIDGIFVGAICTGTLGGCGSVGVDRVASLASETAEAERQDCRQDDKTTRLGQPYPSAACCCLLSVTRVDITTLYICELGWSQSFSTSVHPAMVRRRRGSTNSLGWLQSLAPESWQTKHQR